MKIDTEIIKIIIEVVGMILTAAVSIVIVVFQTRKTIKNQIQQNNDTYIYSIKRLHNEEKFKIYMELNKKACNLIQSTSYLFPPGLDTAVVGSDDENVKLFKERYSKAVNEYNNFITYLYSSSPFVDEAVYEQFNDLSEFCEKQISMYPDVIIRPAMGIDTFMNEYAKECWDRGRELFDKYEKVTKFLKKTLIDEETFE